jgi:protoheme IX farnesyltransferase
MKTILTKLRQYLPLVKSLQTGLLVTTGTAGYMSARCPVFNLWTVAGLLLTLFLSISGSTILNMWWDRDIDAKMMRTKRRPLASGQISADEALRLGLTLSLLGVGLAIAMDALYGLVICAGLFFDVVIYSMWLKRRTAWGIIWGGISGGMPILAGRVLGYDGFDWVGITLSLGVLFWIPTHIMTFSMKYYDDYKLVHTNFSIHVWI